jgi:diaminohydroxyphosphoribosylaminopyrimidine deaminase/5-amino-6-(5-phosphoribosylamino)uracil reductase
MNASVVVAPEGAASGGVSVEGVGGPTSGAGEAALEHDLRHMARALSLAERGRGRVEPNPVVGAVVVRGDRVVGEGWHRRFGGPHAEVEALAAAGEAARGATLYVTLEPCNHTGKTPPCVDAVLRAGISRVVAALADPNPVAAGGAARLRAAGVRVEVGLRAAEAARKNAPFLKRVRLGLPFTTLKWAMSLDGKIATRAGDARWISGETSRRTAHEMRDRADAVLVGIGTALADDPELTTRIEGGRHAIRVVCDARARLPLESRLVRGARAHEGAPLVVAVTAAAPEERVAALREAGALVMPAGPGPDAVDLEALLRALAARGDRPVTNLLVEGGAAIHGAFLDGGLADRVAVFVAPKILGGAAAPGPAAGAGRARVLEALRLAALEARSSGEDVLLEGDLAGIESYIAPPDAEGGA